uniref:Capsid protein n=1 Tax=Hibiscus chlorotic ringspot virus TaxID=53181 RepID=A0A8F3BPK4_9TOMB|nr:coat protein [Hibiscus chlorotic ringspot virus]
MLQKNDPAVQRAFNAHLPWAIKLKNDGWAALSKGQKRAANRYAGGTRPVTSQTKLSTLKVTAPVAASMRTRNPGANIRTAGKSVTVVHCEFVGNIARQTGSGLLVVERTINPSNVLSFPWLSVLAAGYEKYRVSSLSLRYSPTCATTTEGKVILAFDKDAADASPTSKSDMYNHDGAVGVSPWDSAMLQIPCDNVDRFINDSSSSDPKLVDFGKVVVANYGQSEGDVDVIGELFLQYSITLKIPQGTATLTQSGVGISSVGPSLFRVQLREGTYVFTCNGTGRFLFFFNSTVDATSTIAGMEVKQKSSTDDKGETTIMELLATESGGTIAILADTGTLTWWACRN